MAKEKAYFLWMAAFAFAISAAHAQSPQQLIQQVVNVEHAADENDHSQWVYLENIRKPKEHVLQWVAGTPQGNVCRVVERNQQSLSASQQLDLIQDFLHNPKAQKKQISESEHDNRQIDDLLRLLPVAFLWTQTGATATDTFLHFEPAPHFHPPTREARVFSSMAGDLVVDNRSRRVRSMSGRLMHEVNFGGGILGRLKEGSSFSLEQAPVGPSVWELTAFHIHLEGNALLFKSVSLQQDDERYGWKPEPSTVTLDQAAGIVMSQTETTQARNGAASKVAGQEQ